MNLEMSGFIEKDHFDLNSYLIYLFKKFNESDPNDGVEEKKSDCN